MHNSSKREVQPLAQKGNRKEHRPLSAVENKPQQKQAAKKPLTERHDSFVAANKENRKDSGRSKPTPGYLKATVSSRKKVDVKEEWSNTMEKELAGLQGDFAELKRESFRASLAGPGSEIKPPKPFISSASPSGSSLAARLQALKRESAQLLESSSTTSAPDLPPSSGPVAAQVSTSFHGRALQPTTRENARTSVGAERTSLGEICFEAAGQWETPSLAQVAEELFSDPTFAEMCERGLTMQLKRTKDGATAETRIAELAGVSSATVLSFKRSFHSRNCHRTNGTAKVLRYASVQGWSSYCGDA